METAVGDGDKQVRWRRRFQLCRETGGNLQPPVVELQMFRPPPSGRQRLLPLLTFPSHRQHVLLLLLFLPDVSVSQVV